MPLPSETNTLLQLVQALGVLALMAAGVVLLVQDYLQRRRAEMGLPSPLPKQPRTQKKKPQKIDPAPARLARGAELGRLAGVLETARARVDTIATSQRAAARHLDSAEISLNRLLAEIADVMPAAIAPTIVPRRATLAPRPALAA